MVDKKTAAILALFVLLTITGIGWLKTMLDPRPHENTYEWTEIFRGYEAYLDRRIYRAVMQTTSMAPTINVGDSVLWVEVDNKAELKVRDIIIFKHPTRPIDNVCHRIIELGQNGYRFRTQGDNLSDPDRHWVSEELVHGLVIGVIYQRAP